ncbi:MAG: membrane-bound lytic murein transglycosylase F [Myxococcota bacterium]|jgi:membrane-bound lytic murein transglycosylase F
MLRALLVVVCLSACAAGPAIVPHPTPPTFPSPGGPAATPGRDLASIKARGALRVLVPEARSNGIPRTGSPAERELARVDLLARWLGVTVQYVVVRDRSTLLARLNKGDGDLVAALMTRTAERAARATFSNPIRYVREWVVVAANAASPPASARDLAGREIWIRPSSSFAERLREQAKRFAKPPIIRPVAEDADAQQILRAVGEGRYKITIADSDDVEAYGAYRKDIRPVFALNDAAPIAWAVSPKAPKLLSAVNGFISQHVAVHSGGFRFSGDVAEIRQRGLLRVAMLNQPSSFFFYRGVPAGYQFALAHRLAKKLGVRLEVVVARQTSELIQLVVDGHADMTAGTITETPERSASVAFSQPLTLINEVLVQPAGEPPITDVAQLSGRTIVVHRGTAYWRTLRQLQSRVTGLTLQPAADVQDTATLVRLVGTGGIPLTVADYDMATVEASFRKDIRATLALGKGRRRGFAVRPTSPGLLEQVDALVAAERDRTSRGAAGLPSKGPGAHPVAPTPEGALSPYDELAKRQAAAHGVYWRSLVALMEEESGFDRRARNGIGGRGLLQILPHQAPAGANLEDPETGVAAGAKVVASLQKHFEHIADEDERRRLVIAAFHAGSGAVHDALDLARRKNWPLTWTGGVARTLPLLSRSEHAAAARFGYCRGADTVAYVERFEARLVRYRSIRP